MIQFHKYQVAHDLSDFIQSYFVIGNNVGSKEAKIDSSYLRNHPQGTVDLMFAVKGAVSLANHKGDIFSLSNIFVMAQQEGFFEIDFGEDVHIVGVVFYAESFSKLFNFPMHELSNKGCAIDDEVEIEYLELYDQLKEAGGNYIELLNSFFRMAIRKSDPATSNIDELIRWMRSTNIPYTVKQLVSESNLSEKTLQRRMKETTGVTPKSFGNILRFNAAIRLMNNSSQKVDWQDILFQSGYYDQAHFIRDFKRFTGSTPTQFLKEKETLSKLFMQE